MNCQRKGAENAEASARSQCPDLTGKTTRIAILVEIGAPRM
jgi:hypothetical protein